MPDLLARTACSSFDGIVIPGGFGERGIEGKIAAARYAREHDIPLLGLCLGLQVMVIDVARPLAGLDGANSREFDAVTPHPVIDLMDEQHDVVDKGGTMRLGVLRGPARSRVAGGRGVRHRAWSPSATGTATRSTPATGPPSRRPAWCCSGISPDGRLVEFVELPGHPFWVGTQAHPEFKSRPDRPHPLFRELVEAALAGPRVGTPACPTSMPITER